MLFRSEWTDVTRAFVPHDTKIYSWWSYRAQDWAGAQAALGQCRGRDPRLEALYDLYDERLAWFVANPPAPDWDGVFVALSK